MHMHDLKISMISLYLEKLWKLTFMATSIQQSDFLDDELLQLIVLQNIGLP